MSLLTDVPSPAKPYWAAPPKSLVGDADQSLIYLNVGMALSKWGNVEGIFAMLFTLFIDARTLGAARVFGSIGGLMGKVDALKAATGAAFFQRGVSADDQRDWKLLLEHYREATDRRNEIAHGMVMGYQIEDEERGSFLVPVYNTKKSNPFWMNEQAHDFLDRLGQYRYTSGDIAYLSDKFRQLNGWGVRFHIAYSAKYGTPGPRPNA
jgi:hypothetical protein